AADVERAHRELRSRLANRLSRDDADRFSSLDHPAGGEIAPIAELADAALRFAGQHRANFYDFLTGGLDGSGNILGNFRVGLNDDVAFVVELIFESDAADDAVAQVLDDFARFDDRRDFDSVAGAAIVFRDDHVLSDVAKTAREVARIGRFES